MPAVRNEGNFINVAGNLRAAYCLFVDFHHSILQSVFGERFWRSGMSIGKYHTPPDEGFTMGPDQKSQVVTSEGVRVDCYSNVVFWA